MDVTIGTMYAGLRRVARTALTRSVVLDGTLGHALRRLERRLPVGRWYMHDGTVSCQGLTFHYTAADSGIVPQMRLNGDYEPETREAMQSLLAPGMAFVDLGAHIGYFSLLAARAVGTRGRVYAFEPTPQTFQSLQANCQLNGFADRIQVERLAISDAPGIVRFACQNSSTSNKIAGEANSDGKLIELQATSLDAYFQDLGWPSVDLIKMDIEGAELPAVRGMEELSRRNPQLKLIFEYLHQNLLDNEVSPAALFDRLVELGFTRFRILLRNHSTVQIPADLAKIDKLAKSFNLNILAEK